MSLPTPAERVTQPVASSSRLRVLFYVGALCLFASELLNVYFIMPFPGSQRMRSIDLAYALFEWRWPLRVLCGGLLVAGFPAAWRAGGRRRWLVAATLALVAAGAFVANYFLAADQAFQQPRTLILRAAATNAVPGDRLVVGIEVDGEARAYPLWFIGYHHQVRDRVGGREVLVSYCTVCRTGRVFSPYVEGKLERFRLVGMDHFNAMFEDASTGSWWRQANGEAITGRRKGMRLDEIPSQQVTLKQWLELHPESLVMQADPSLVDEYTKSTDFETGASRKRLTGTNPASWEEKSWVVGIASGGHSKAYDWNRLKRERVINDEVGGTPIVLVLAADSTSFFAFVRPDAATRFELHADSLVSPTGAFPLTGGGPAGALAAIGASQEFWLSWRTFHPETERY